MFKPKKVVWFGICPINVDKWFIDGGQFYRTCFMYHLLHDQGIEVTLRGLLHDKGKTSPTQPKFWADVYNHPNFINRSEEVRAIHRVIMKDHKETFGKLPLPEGKSNTSLWQTRMFDVLADGLKVKKNAFDLAVVEIPGMMGMDKILLMACVIWAYNKANIPILIIDQDNKWPRTVSVFNVCGRIQLLRERMQKVPILMSAPVPGGNPRDGIGYHASKLGGPGMTLWYPYHDKVVPKLSLGLEEAKYELMYIGADYKRQEEFIRFYAAMPKEKAKVALVGNYKHIGAAKKDRPTIDIFQEMGSTTDFLDGVPFSQVIKTYRQGLGTVNIARDDYNKIGWCGTRQLETTFAKRLIMFSNKLQNAEAWVPEDQIVENRAHALDLVRTLVKIPSAYEKCVKEQKKRARKADIKVQWPNILKKFEEIGV